MVPTPTLCNHCTRCPVCGPCAPPAPRDRYAFPVGNAGPQRHARCRCSIPNHRAPQTGLRNPSAVSAARFPHECHRNRTQPPTHDVHFRFPAPVPGPVRFFWTTRMGGGGGGAKHSVCGTPQIMDFQARIGHSHQESYPTVNLRRPGVSIRFPTSFCLYGGTSTHLLPHCNIQNFDKARSEMDFARAR